MKFSTQQILAWLTVFEQVEARGEAAYKAIKAVLVDHGIDADTSALDELIADATRRQARAQQDAGGSDVSGNAITGP